MRRKFKGLLAASIACVTLLFSGVFVACSKLPFFSDLGKTKLNGFDVKETVTVDYGALVTVETPIVTDDEGNFYEVMSEVTDSKGGYVVVEANSFRAWDVEGYEINYVVRVDNNQAEKKTTAVNVINTQALTVTAEHNEFEDTDSNILITPECDEEVEYAYSVKNLRTQEEISVEFDGAQAYFVCEDAGNYEVVITANQGERYGSYGYTVIVREAVGRTNVEHFDEQWEEIAKYLGDERVGRYTLVSSQEIGLKDRYGDDAYFLEFSSVAEWLTYYISPRYSKEHYEALAAEGYDQVTVYCYLVSKQNKAHKYAIRTMPSGFYERTAGPSYPNQWNEINMNLEVVPGKETNRSFLLAYEYYQTQEGWFLCYNNEGDLATRDELTLYFSDMYVTKPVEITTVENAKTDYKVGDYISKDTMNEFFTSESSMRYFVNFRGTRVEITGDYEFTANGEYVLEALPERKDERGTATVTLTVTDDFSATYTYLAEERTSGAVSVNLTKLKAGFTTIDGVTPTVSGYKVYDRYGAEYAVVDKAFAASADGAYNVEVEGTYELSGKTYKTYGTVYVDVWSQATKYKAVAVEDMYSANAWKYQSTRKQTMEVGEYTVGGVTAKAWKFTKSGDNVTLTVKPFYTKQYYQNMLDNSATELVLGMSVYFDSGAQTSANMNTCRSFFSDYLKCTYEKDTWLMEVAELSAFIEKYDSFNAGYEFQTYNVANGIEHGYTINGPSTEPPIPMWKDYVFYAEMNSRADYVYVQDMTVYPIQTVAETQLVERTDSKIAMSALQDAFTAEGFAAKAIVKATRNGVDVTATGDSFVTGETDGVYEVYVQGTKNGETLVLKLSVDVWSQASKNTVIALEDIFIIGGYEYQSHIKENIAVGEYAVDGTTAQMLQLTAKGTECAVVVGKPLHSKKYYQELLAKDVYYTSYVTMSWYFMDAVGKESNVTPYYDVFSNYERQGVQTKNAWLSGKITLADFVAQYDDFVALYDRTMEEYALQAEAKYGRFADTRGVVDRQGNVIGGYLMATKFQSNKIDHAYFTQPTIEKAMKTEEANTLLVDRSQTSTLDVNAIVNAQPVVEYWKSEGYAIACEVTARYGGVKVNNGGTVAISASLEDGIYYLKVTATKGEHTGVCFAQELDLYNSTDEIVEYENFKHSDSKYAIRIYWAKFSKQGFSYSNTTFNIQSPTAWGATLDNVAFGEGEDPNTLYILRQDTATLTKASDSETGTTDENYIGRELGYIAYSWSSQDTYDKLQYAHENGAYYQYIFTYVLPRHSKAYYQAFASQADGNLEMLYKSTSSNREGLGRMRYMYATDIVDGKIKMAYTGNVWSSSNQATTGYTVTVKENADGTTTTTDNTYKNVVMNINTIIDNYDSFANCKVPMLVMMHMAGTKLDSKESRIYEMGFHKTVSE